MKLDVKEFKTGAAMAACAAGIFKKALLKKKGKLLTAVSGGRTPGRLFKKLSSMQLPWERVIFFLADERRVPLCSPQSNFRAARTALFSRIKIPRANLHPVKTGRGAAADYGRSLLKETSGSGQLDLIVLGLGADGHTASLFPGSPALTEKVKPVCAVTAPPGIIPRRRVTLSLRTINNASVVVLLAAGPVKKAMFQRALLRDKKIPAGLLSPRGELHLLFSENE